MAKYKIVHYLNQFFGGIGGEDKAAGSKRRNYRTWYGTE